MKRFFLVSGIVMAISVTFLTSLYAQQEQNKTAAPAQPQQVGALPATPAIPGTEGPVVYTFKDDADLKQFQQLAQSRQLVNTRIAVLQAYLAAEASNIQQLNGQLSLNYKIDPDKNYMMDPKGKVIRELPPPPKGQTAAAATTATAATPATPK